MNLFKKFGVSLVLLVAAFCAQAATETVNGITWTYTVSNGKAEIYSGRRETPAIPSSTKGAITIPSTLGGYPVTSIGSSAFFGCSGLTSVTIPDSVTSIGDWAFENCSGLTSVTIPNGVTKIGNRAFQYCTNLVSVVIPGTVKTIGTSSFANCSKLSGITIPKSVESLPSSAFTGCEALWMDWYRALANLVANGGGSSGGETAAVPDPRYDITACPADRSVSTVTVDGDMAIDSFVLSKGKVYDTVLRVINVSGIDATLSLPQGYIYEQFKGAKPLVIPPASTNLLTITRTADKVFLVSREELEIAQ